MEATKDTLASLVLATEWAKFREAGHQKMCRQFSAGLDCQSCTDHERAWLAADRQLDAFLDAARELERQAGAEDDGRYGNVSAFG